MKPQVIWEGEVFFSRLVRGISKAKDSQRALGRVIKKDNQILTECSIKRDGMDQPIWERAITGCSQKPGSLAILEAAVLELATSQSPQ